MLTNGHAQNGSTQNGSTHVLDLPGLTHRGSAYVPSHAETRPPDARLPEAQETLRQAIESARSTYEELEARTLELQKLIRREEHTVGQWRRKLQDLEDQVARCRPILADAEARLERARQDYENLARRVRDGREGRRPSDRAA